MSVGHWHDAAWAAIERIHSELPINVSLAQRKQALKNGYPFGPRSYWPYKAWLKARRQYLAKYEPPKPLPMHLLDGWK